MNPYEVLGISSSASAEEIKNAFRQKAKQHHPDMNQGDPAAEAKFKEISAAYEMLSNPKPQQSNGFEGFPDLEEILRQQFGHMFRQQVKNADLQTFCDITLDQSFTGCEVEIRLDHLSNAPLYRLKIPRGVEANSRIRVQGGGRVEYPQLPPGDLYVIVRIRPHNTYQRQGANLITQVHVDTLDAIVGTRATIFTLDGENLSVEIPAGTQYGDTLRVVGKGMYDLTGNRGDILVQLLLQTPTKLDETHHEIIGKMIEKLSNLLRKDEDVS